MHSLIEFVFPVDINTCRISDFCSFILEKPVQTQNDKKYWGKLQAAGV